MTRLVTQPDNKDAATMAPDIFIIINNNVLSANTLTYRHLQYNRWLPPVIV